MWLQEKKGREGGKERGRGEGGRRGHRQKVQELSQELDQVPIPAPPRSSCVTLGKCVVLSGHIDFFFWKIRIWSPHRLVVKL